MHKKKTNRSRIAATLSVILAVLFGGLFAQSVRAVISNPTPICVGSNCTVTFDATGDYYLWTPPSGARNISFDLMGAQGGRSGGLGGRVTGSLNSVPTSLYIYVGGAGNTGSGFAGGFNGGGTAGGGRGDEGSGGGATDIRSTTAIGDRLVVAAGGGGSGGFGGGTGGAAGGSTGNAGTSGQGQGGSGASQGAGGNGGSPNGGTWGTGGSLGLGGQGGTSSTSGGGGGGGGYYGGGGGGADIDGCCTNGGGGGGGSSWHNTSLTTAVVHTGGYRAGAGVAIISYVMPPSVLTFAPAATLTNATSLSYNLVFSESVTGLTSADFVTTNSTATCSSIALTGIGSSYVVTASGCTVGTFKLTLIANTVSGIASGPTTDNSATDVVIERTQPMATVAAPASPTNSAILNFTISFSELVSGLTGSDFLLNGASCQIGTISGSGQSYVVPVSACADGSEVSLTLAANSVADGAQNTGPFSNVNSMTVQVDRSAANPVWSTSVSTSFVSPSFEINFSEAVTGFTSNDLANSGTATGCLISLASQTVTRYSVTTSGCSLGTVLLSVAQNSYTDPLGNLGPTTVSVARLVTVIAQPAPTPTASPTPSASPTPVPTEPSSNQGSSPAAPIVTGKSDDGPGANSGQESGTAAQIFSNYEIVPAQPLRKTYALAPLFEQQTKPQSPGPQITVDNPTDDLPAINQENQAWWFSWQTLTSWGVGITSIALAGIGVYKAARQFRTRRLVKKFA